MTGVVAAFCVALLLVFGPYLMRNLPASALGAVVISACGSIFEISQVRRLYDLRRVEFYLSMICFLGVVSLGVIQGIFIAIGVALLTFIWRAWRPYCAVLGRVDGVKGYHDITRHPEARRIPGLVLFRWDAPLFFANAEMFREQTLRAVTTAPTPTKCILVAAEPVTDVDITAADVLAELEDELKQAGIELCFAQMKGPVKDHLKRLRVVYQAWYGEFLPHDRSGGGSLRGKVPRRLDRLGGCAIAGCMTVRGGLFRGPVYIHFSEHSMNTQTHLSLGFSPCPNDTFMFYPLIRGLVDTAGISYHERLEDVETLNLLALSGELDISKVSYHALGHIRDNYTLLRSGSALGRGCGPLLVSSANPKFREPRAKTVAVPGRYTTALLLLRLFDPSLDNFLVMPFNEIMDAVLNGNVDAGLIIHESRFTYRSHGLRKLVDLGEWWEAETGLPIPLGGIVARRSLGRDTIWAVERALRDGVAHARGHPCQAVRYIREHAQEMSGEVLASHIELYVNDFSLDLGDEGVRAIQCLMERGERAGIIPASSTPLF